MVELNKPLLGKQIDPEAKDLSARIQAIFYQINHLLLSVHF